MWTLRRLLLAILAIAILATDVSLPAFAETADSLLANQRQKSIQLAQPLPPRPLSATGRVREPALLRTSCARASRCENRRVVGCFRSSGICRCIKTRKPC
jgi:hypothetical protein